MNNKSAWQQNAEHVKEIYGAYVNWDERFYICVCCGEPVYECDWSNDELYECICPVCGDVDLEDEEEDDE